MTSTQEEKTGQTAIGRWFVHNPWPLIVFIIAFTVGSRALKQIVTPDELAWVFRSIHFRQALSQQDWPNIVQSGHPGFITMWLGTVGTTIKLWLQPELQSEIDWILQQNWRLPSSGELSHRLYPFLQPARNIISLFMAGLWTAVYFLIKQRVGKEIAPLALLFLITDIWIIGLTHILHVDGLLAMFCLLTLLLVLPRRDDDLQFYGRRRYLLTGVAIAGAILTKVPGLLLLAIVPGILVMQWWFQRRSQRRSQRKKGLFTALTFVFIGLLATLALFAPVIFINPTYVFQRIFVQGSREVGFSAPTFFLGQITENPGLFFYPLVIFFRQRALITIGLIIASVQLIRTKDGRNQWFFMSAVGAFCLLFWLGLLVSDREFDRYIFPAALPISMIGAVSIAKFVKQFTNNKLVIIAISLSLLANLYYYEKDPFSMINPLVGGPWNGSSLMLTGWGGGQSYAAKEISLTPNTLLLTDNVPATAPFVAYPNNVLLLTPQTAWLGEFDDVVILSLEHQQLNPHDWLPNSVNFPASQQGRPIRYAGVDRAWLFSDFDQDFLNQGVSRYDSADFNFNNSLKLSEATAIKPDDDFNIHLLLRWAYAQPEDGVLQFTIVDAADNVWIQREDPLINIEDVPASLWTPNANYLSIHSLPLASDMPPGDYSVRVSHFRTDGSLSGITHTDEFIGTVATLATF
ncbi:MAG: 4-amino-4-deoxy-L-arabinose transferase-like glycosyltransferase, partial [Cellvibrionaceae bacterium]